MLHEASSSADSLSQALLQKHELEAPKSEAEVLQETVDRLGTRSKSNLKVKPENI